MKKLIKKLCRIYPEYFALDNALVRKRYEHILSGFFLERTRGSIYVYVFIFPLFDNSEVIHLLYSNRVGHISLDSSGKGFSSGKDYLNQICEIIDKSDFIVPGIISLKDFCNLMESMNGVLDNPHGQLVYSFCNVLLGNFGVAENYMKKSLINLHHSRTNLCERALSMIQSDPAKLIAYLESEEINFKRRYLSHS